MTFNYERLRNNVGITDFSPGSFVRGILDAFSAEYRGVVREFDTAQVQILISRATGTWLDLWGEIVGVERLDPVTAKVTNDAKIIKFHTYASNFAAINSGNPIVLYPGIKIYSTANAEGKQVVYLVGGNPSDNLVLSATENSQFVSAVAQETSTGGDVEENTLVNHNFTNYTDASNNSLLVTNITSISLGRPRETDDSYRYRITNKLRAGAAANRVAIKLAALAIPGVSSVKFIQYNRGIGTSDMLVIANTANTPQSLVDRVQEVINPIVGEGNSVLCRKPYESGVELVISLKYNDDATISTTDDLTIKNQIRKVLTNYINNIRTESKLSINALQRLATSVDGRIDDIGQPNQPFDEIFIYKYSVVEGQRVRQRIRADYYTSVDETLMVEPSLDEPITIG